MKNSYLFWSTIVSAGCLSVFAQAEMDTLLQKYIKQFRMKPPQTEYNINPKKYEFGKKLFQDTNLSLAGNISCQTCHTPQFGTGDGIPFSIGTGGDGIGRSRIQKFAGITARNSPHLFNKGHRKIKSMFWDGRVRKTSNIGVYETPEPGLNGENPKYDFIVNKIENVMAMQALFPMTDALEMRGETYSHLTNLQVWELVTEKVKRSGKYNDYLTPDFNIADIANALAYFQKIEFQVNDTPFDHYMRGRINSLSRKEKLGAKVFFENGRCSRCHFGELMSNDIFQSVAVPQVGKGVTNSKNDLGHFHVTNNERHKYNFKTQPLRNVALTAPFFHNGAYNTLREVIAHYNNPARALNNYDVARLQNLFGQNYNDFIYVDKNHYNNFYRIQSLHQMLKTPLNLTQAEMNHLECFLKKSLTQAKYHSQLDLAICEE